MGLSESLLLAADQVSGDQIHEYLEVSGWERVPVRSDSLSAWQIQAHGRLFGLKVPLNPDFADYRIRVAEALSTIREVTGLPVGQVLVAVVGQLDVIEVRADQATVIGGSIPLSEGKDLILATYRMLRAAAGTVTERRRTVPSSLAREAEEYIKDARLGQTSTGSYVFRVLTPTGTSAFCRYRNRTAYTQSAVTPGHYRTPSHRPQSSA